MSACEVQLSGATNGVAAALRAVDCMASETTATAFGRLFGGGGALTPVLTIVLTLYIAFFAISLLTGRSRIGISALTPRMLTLGLALTFATSWVAYQGVVWNLAIGGPDQIAGVLVGAQGSATEAFADRIDTIFSAIAEVDETAGNGQGAANVGSFTPPSLMWLAALLLLLGTVGVLVTARIALAVLLALGPIFVIMSLFAGTRGLFVGWLRGVVLTAVTPLFAVLGGGFMLEIAVPVIAGLRGVQGIDGRAAMALFLIAAVHVALMSLVIRVATTMVGGWQVFGLAGSDANEGSRTAATAPSAPNAASAAAAVAAAVTPLGQRRTIALMPSAALATASGMNGSTSAPASRSMRGAVVAMPAPHGTHRPIQPLRARGIGSRFASRAVHSREFIR